MFKNHLRVTKAAFIGFIVMAIPLFSQAATIYSNDFQGVIGNEWSKTDIGVPPNDGTRKFLGPFAEDTVNLTLSSLPSHSYISLEFDLFIMASWDGDGPEPGTPDIWTLDVKDGPVLLHTTFSNFPNRTQDYPESYDYIPGGALNPPKTGAEEIDTLGYAGFLNFPGGDSIYHLSFEFPHEDDDVTIIFTGKGLTSVRDESWGLDNVKITYDADEYLSIYVDDDAPGDNDGSSWSNAYLCLQDALTVAQDGDEIRVAKGIYRPDRQTVRSIRGRPRLMIMSSGNSTATFQLINDVVIKGGYAGFGEPDPDTRDVDQYSSILSGDLNADDGPQFTNISENSYHVVTASGTEATAVLDGFTITGGNAQGFGGGMRNTNSSPSIIDCCFTDNYAGEDGGGMYNVNSSPSITDCCFTGNYAGEDGGGMSNRNSSPTVANCTFMGNSTFDGGGGMHNRDESHPTVTDCTFRENLADDGGGIQNISRSSPTIANCTFVGNSVAGSGSNNGGGIDNTYDSHAIITNCSFTENSATYGGAMLSGWGSSPVVANCLFVRNSAQWGGGMYNIDSSSITFTNCTFSENLAQHYGSAIYNNNCTVAMTNSIVWGNAPNSIIGSATTVTYSNVEGGWPSGRIKSNIDTDPLFVGGGNCRLKAGSPCIDAGNDAAVSSSTDLDGNIRIQGAAVDMGAFEGTLDTDSEILDQSQTIIDYGFWFEKDVIRWQEFIPERNNITSVEVNIDKRGTPGDMIVEIRTTDDISLAQKIVAEVDAPSYGWARAEFTTPVHLSPGTKYRIYVYSNTVSLSPENRYFWTGNTASTYCPPCDTDVSDHWPGYDYAFKIYGMGNKRDPELPRGLISKWPGDEHANDVVREVRGGEGPTFPFSFREAVLHLPCEFAFPSIRAPYCAIVDSVACRSTDCESKWEIPDETYL